MGGSQGLTDVQVSAGALSHNVAAFRSLVGPAKSLIAVVKGNAYGHGLREVVGILDPWVDGFQVDDLDELVALREVTGKRALVLGYVARADVAAAVALGGELTVYDLERLESLASCPGARVHLKIDALLGRQGLLPEGLGSFLDLLEAHPTIRVESAYAHFANIEDTTDLVHAQEQLRVFEDAFQFVRGRFPSVLRHISATSGALTVESSNDLVRLGIGIYGLYPSIPLARQHSALGLRPVMRWRTMLAQIKTLPARHPVGYGLTFMTSRPTRIGIVPQGYADGYDRGLSNSGEVLVQGRRCAVLGRVAMNMFAIDLTAVPEAKPEDEVVLLGHQGDDRITAEEIAGRIGTINYEITTRVSPLLTRVVME